MRYSDEELLGFADTYLAHNYSPFPVFIERGDGCWVWDRNSKKYLDMLSCYSALNFGHLHPRIVLAVLEQLCRVTTVPGCLLTEEKTLFIKELTEFCGMEMVLPMNTGAEAVETALKMARKWGYVKKNIPENEAEIIVLKDNFHGRTITIVSFSTESQYKDNFGPHTPGFKVIPFGDAQALRDAITPNTCAFLVEPIQGEGGINVPPDGYLKECLNICRENNVLFMADEIQTGFSRTGDRFACDYEDVKPDVYILCKALGGGVMPVSAVVSSREIMGVYNPGDHGSTFAGSPLACHVGREALRIHNDEQLSRKAYFMGAYFTNKLKGIKSPHLLKIRGRGLLIGLELTPGSPSAHSFCEKLIDEGILCKEARTDVIRLSPPLTITSEDIYWATDKIEKVLS